MFKTLAQKNFKGKKSDHTNNFFSSNQSSLKEWKNVLNNIWTCSKHLLKKISNQIARFLREKVYFESWMNKQLTHELSKVKICQNFCKMPLGNNI